MQIQGSLVQTMSGSNFFMEIDHEIVSTVIFLLLSQGYKQKYVHKVLVNCLVNLTKVKESVVR